MITSRRKVLAMTLAASPVSLPDSAFAGKGGCGLGIGTYGLQSMPLDKAIRLVAETGFDVIEITVFPGSTGDKAGALISSEARREIRKLISGSGLRLGALMCDLKPESDEGRHRGQLSTLVGLIKLAHDLSPDDPPLLQTILGRRDWDSSKELFRDRIADWIRILGDQKGRVSIKPHRSQAMGSPTQANWLFQQLGHPKRLGMVYDYSHYAFLDPPLSIEETVDQALPITNYVAVKDARPKDGKIRFALPGESGQWDHAKIISRLFEGGYRGDFCCEVSSQIWRNNPGYDPVKVTRTCYRNLSAAFERASVSRL